MSAIYLIETPNGKRLVGAKTRATAINFVVKDTITAKALTATQLANLLQGPDALKIEQAGDEPKPETAPAEAHINNNIVSEQ